MNLRAALPSGKPFIWGESGGENYRSRVLDFYYPAIVDRRNILVVHLVLGQACVPVGAVASGSNPITHGVRGILLLLILHMEFMDDPHNDITHLELAPIGIVVGSDLDALCTGIILLDNDVVVIVIEFLLVTSFYFSIRDGILLEVIVIARCHPVDALDAIFVAIPLSTLCITQDNPADSIAVDSLYGDAGTLCQLVDGTAARSAGGVAITERNFHKLAVECRYFLLFA